MHPKGQTTGSVAKAQLTVAALALACLAAGCSQELDAGSSRPAGKLPVDARSPIILTNDGATDNWQGEYAMLLANGGGSELAGIVVSASSAWPDLELNVSGWRELVSAARESGLRGIPDPIASISSPLVRPASGRIEDTAANRSEGALFILSRAAELAEPYRPLVVATGGRLTDIADAYLVDPSITERVVVVSSLGKAAAAGAHMGRPNGELDAWSSEIVASRFRYVQVNAYYDQLLDVPESRTTELPANSFGDWIAAKRADILDLPEASDQVGVVAVGMASFATFVERVSPSAMRAETDGGPDLAPDPDGSGWLVREGANAVAMARFWELLLDPRTFSD